MTDQYWEGYRDGCADTRERFLAKPDKEIERLRAERKWDSAMKQRLYGEVSRLSSRIHELQKLLREVTEAEWPWSDNLCRRIDSVLQRHQPKGHRWRVRWDGRDYCKDCLMVMRGLDDATGECPGRST